MAILAVLGVTALLWVVGQVAAALFGAHHWLKIGLGEMASVPLHLIHHPGDPKLAWPVRVRGQLPGPVGMYAALVLVLSLPAVVFGLVAGNRFGHDRKLRERGSTWASALEPAPPDRVRASARPDHAGAPWRLAGPAAAGGGVVPFGAGLRTGCYL